MTVTTIAGVDVDLNEEGFLTDPSQWTEDVAVELARREGIDPLTDRHWEVIRFMRAEYEAKGTGPDRAHPGQDVGRARQGAVPAVPQGPGQAGRQDRRHPQAARLHLNPPGDGHHDEEEHTMAEIRSRRCRSSSPRGPWKGSTRA